MTYQELLNIFEIQLTSAKLKESTIFTHVDNMQFFYEHYLNIPLSKTIHESDVPSYGINTIDDFFSIYYIEQCNQAGKTDLTRYLGTIKKFFTMLHCEGYITLTEKQNLLHLIKENKEKWLDPFNTEYEFDDDWFDPRDTSDFFPNSIENSIQEAISGLLSHYSPLKKVLDHDINALAPDSVITQIMKQYDKEAHQFDLNLIKKVYQEIFSFAHNYQPWRFITNTDLFAIEHPDLSDRYYIGVLGNGGLEFGINLYRGNENIPILLNMTNSIYEIESEASDNYTMFIISLDTNEYAWPTDIFLQKSSGFKFPPALPYPIIRKLSRGKSVLGVDIGDLHELSLLLPLVNNLLRNMIANKTNIGSFMLSQFVLRKYKTSDSFTDTVHSIKAVETSLLEPQMNDIALAQVRRLKVKKNISLEIDAFHFGHFVKLDNRFIHPLLFVCAGFIEGDYFHSEIYEALDTISYVKLIQDEFMKVLLQLGQLPKSIMIRKNSYLDGIVRVCELLSISVIYITEYAMIGELKHIGKQLLM